MKHVFRHMKYLLCSVSALSLLAVLAQKHSTLAYFSKLLPLIVRVMMACLRGVAATASTIVKKCQNVVLRYPLILHASHAVNLILLNNTNQHGVKEDLIMNPFCWEREWKKTQTVNMTVWS